MFISTICVTIFGANILCYAFWIHFKVLEYRKSELEYAFFPMRIFWGNIVCNFVRNHKLFRKSTFNHSSTQPINGLTRANNNRANQPFLFDKILLCSFSSSLMGMEIVRFLCFPYFDSGKEKLFFWSCTAHNETKPTEHFARSFVVKQYPNCLQSAFLLPSTKWGIRRTLLGEEVNKRKVSSVKMICLFRLYLDI